MKIDLRVSDKMSEKVSPLGSIENRLIRMSKELRSLLGLKINQYVNLTTKSGGVIALKVTRTYLDDANEGNFAFVSSEIYNKLQTESKHAVIPTDDILIGCDPEFFIVERDTDDIISASNFFPLSGFIGSDCGLAEIRPNPSKSPDMLLFNTAKLLKQANEVINNRKLLKDKEVYMAASSTLDRTAAGFHIHFGLPAQALSEDDIITETLRHRIVTILDYYVGILSIIPEGKEDSMRRAYMAGQYGKPGDFRYDYLTFEYRVPGGHLLRHPTLTRGLFAISKLVMSDILSRIKMASSDFRDMSLLKDYNSIRSLYPRLPDRSVVYYTITSTEIDGALSFVNTIADDLKKMSDYRKYSEAIEDYLNFITMYSSKKYTFSKDIASNWRDIWGLADEIQPGKMAVHKSSYKASVNSG